MAIAATAATLSNGSNLTTVSVIIRPGFKLGDVLTIRVDGHGSGPIIDVAGLRTDAEPDDVNEALGLLCNIDGAANDDEKATERPPDEGM